MFGFLTGRTAQLLTAFLFIQVAVFQAVARRTEFVPQVKPLATLPLQLGAWSTKQEFQTEKEVMDVLRADDTLSRTWGDPAGKFVTLFVAFFKSQRTGVTPHSPKNCLPGNGWVQLTDSKMYLPIPGRTNPIEVNYYIVQRGEMKQVTMYWYQSRDRVVANEFKARFYVVRDAIAYNRTDTSLVRVMVPFSGNDVQGATDTAREFAQTLFNPLSEVLPKP